MNRLLNPRHLHLLLVGFYEIVPVSSGDEASDSCDEFSSLSTEKKRKLGPKRKAKMREIFEGYRYCLQHKSSLTLCTV